MASVIDKNCDSFGQCEPMVISIFLLTQQGCLPIRSSLRQINRKEAIAERQIAPKPAAVLQFWYFFRWRQVVDVAERITASYAFLVPFKCVL